MPEPGSAEAARPSPLAPILTLTFLASLGTGILWSGIAFVAKHDLGYSAELNLLLFTATACAYIAGAFGAGPVTRAAGWLLSPRGVVAAILSLQAAICLLPLASTSAWTIWFVAVAISVLAAMLWPIVESFLTAGRHGDDLRRAMGWWNVAWTGAVAISLIAMAPLIERRAALAVVALTPISVLALLAVPGFARAPGQHEAVFGRTSITDEYPLLLSSARVLLPAAYMLIGALSPLMPYRLEEVGAPPLAETPATATWMVARVVAIAALWQLPYWHGRWGTLLIGGLGMTAGFGIVVAAPNLGMLLFGLALFGAAQGVVYYAALYYAMTVGAAAVEAGGTHEGLIGVGYAVGPLTALAGAGLPQLAGFDVDPATGIVVTVTLVLALAMLPAVRPYRVARRRREPTRTGS